MSKTDNTRIGDRMKNNYENPYKHYLPWRMPTILRLDGKSFHTWTRGLERPFDDWLISKMQDLMKELCGEVQNTVLGYSFSDEISLLLHPYKRIKSQPWFSNEIQKIVSVASGIASSYFTEITNKRSVFDCRAFVLPEEEVVNYFLWRQQDAERNSIQMVAQSMYSQKELDSKKKQDLHELIHLKGDNWNDYPTSKKRGSCCTYEDGWNIDTEIPIFSKDRGYIEKYIDIEDQEGTL